jgi:hypothetical protein
MGVGPFQSFAKVRQPIVPHRPAAAVNAAEYRSWVYEQFVSSLPPLCLETKTTLPPMRGHNEALAEKFGGKLSQTNFL